MICVGNSSQHDVFLVFPTEKRHQGAIRVFCGQPEAANQRWAAAKRRWSGRGPQHAAGPGEAIPPLQVTGMFL